MENFEMISGIASILSLIISLFVARKVYSISAQIEVAINNHDDDSISQKLTGIGQNTQIGHNVQSGRDTVEK